MGDNDSDANGGKDCVGTAVIMRVNSAPILESAKHDFYFVPLFIKLFVIGHRSFPTISARNTRRDSFTGKAFATSRHHSLYPPRVPWPMAEKQDRGALVITHLTAGQMERYRLTGGIANGMEF